jgi:formylmethanofuran dehydrogenase subunit E
MKYPQFFDEIPTIILQDDLASFLGSVDDGIIEFRYIDIVKIAGHSCPTVLGAYMMIQKALEALYRDDTPKRGEIIFEFKDEQTFGITGVMANIATSITGATTNFGFKGLNGKFDRCKLMSFGNEIDGVMKVTRLDTNKSVSVNYDISSIQKPEKLGVLMQKSLHENASSQEKKEFAMLWQKGVENIFRNIEQHIIIK